MRQRKVEAELAEEIETHRRIMQERLEQAGMSGDEARYASSRALGNASLAREDARAVWIPPSLESVWQDARYGFRNLLRTPGFTAVVLSTLALGIGLNSAIFSVVDAVLLQPLPYADPERLVTIFESDEANSWTSRNAAAPGNFLDWRLQNRVFEQIGAVSLPGYNLTDVDPPERVLAAAVSAGMLHLLGLRPFLGREIDTADDRSGATGVVMVSHSLWHRRFSGDPGFVGRTIHLGPLPYRVIGILPPGLQFPTEDVDVWVPLEQTIAEQDMRWRNSHYLSVYARLKPGVTLEQARSEMNGIAKSLKRAYPDSNSGAGTILVAVQEDLVGDIRPALVLLLGAVGLVLLIACANVANLLLVRATAREKEMAIRLALGAARVRLVRQMLLESLLLSVAGGGAGLIVSGWGRDLLLELRPASLPLYNPIETDGRVLLFTLCVSVVTGIIFGLTPALRAARADPCLFRGTARGATHRAAAHRLRNTLVFAEIALSVVLLAGAGLLIRSFLHLRGGRLGFRTDHTVTARVSIPIEKYDQDSEVVSFYDGLLERVRAIPAVESAGAVSFLPLTGQNFNNSFDIVGRTPRSPSDRTYALVRFVDPHYFGVLGIPVLSGRGIAVQDRGEAPRVVVISDGMARHYWPGASPVGQRLNVYMGMDQSPWEIVGVVGDVRSNINAEPEPTIYFPYAQFPYRWMVLTARTHGTPDALLESIRTAVRSLDPEQPLSQVRTLDELMSRMLVPWRFSMTLLGAFAGLALLLASAGIYGVVSYTAGKRTGEIGIRMALGAQRRDVIRLLLRQGMLVAGAGIAAGLCGAFYLTRFLATQLYGIRPTDPLTFTMVPLVLWAVAFAASYIPVRRATRTDPMSALRCE
jgi:putative ABC transport system permease protein